MLRTHFCHDTLFLGHQYWSYGFLAQSDPKYGLHNYVFVTWNRRKYKEKENVLFLGGVNVDL